MLYSLLVGTEPSGESTEDFHISGGRFLEYTAKGIASQFDSLAREARATLMSWPCLCMAEGRGDERAVVGRITAIDNGGVGTVATVRTIRTSPQLNNDAIWRLRDALDIGQFEFSRHHWAIKERDLLAVLSQAAVRIAPDDIAQFGRLPLPAPERRLLIEAKRLVGEWGHTEITDFLLEAGVRELAAPASMSRRDRANAILEYILDHPSALTAEGHLLSAFFVRESGLQPEVALVEPPAIERPGIRPVVAADQRSTNRVFVVHGSNSAVRASVATLLTQFGLEPIILNEQPNMGRHLLTKFIDEAAATNYAVVLLTDDDVGGKAGGVMSPRARQNVILELGYFIAHLGQERVCALKSPGVEAPSDFDGIVYISMADVEPWAAQLHRELRAAGLPVRAL